MNNDFHWTLPAMQKLSELWAEGHSGAEIGRRLGVSKNSVLGKAHRLRLPSRPSPITGDRKPRRPHIYRAVGPTLPALKSVVIPERAPSAIIAPAFSLHPCRWPMWPHGAMPNHQYCGDRSLRGRPYCVAHAAKATAQKAVKATEGVVP